jgi:hypothetical protein
MAGKLSLAERLSGQGFVFAFSGQGGSLGGSENG